MLLLSILLLAEQVDLEVHKVGDEMITQEIHWRVGWALGEGCGGERMSLLTELASSGGAALQHCGVLRRGGGRKMFALCGLM